MTSPPSGFFCVQEFYSLHHITLNVAMPLAVNQEIGYGTAHATKFYFRPFTTANQIANLKTY